MAFRSSLFIPLILVGVSMCATAVSAARAPTSFAAAQTVVATSSSPGNAYVAGTSVVLTAPVAGDFGAFGGSVITAAPVAGDDLLFGGSIHSRSSVGGDFRALGGTISIDEPVKGDVIAFGYNVDDRGRAGGSVLIGAANASVADGAAGPVTIYGNNVLLGGDFESNVHIVASGRVTLAASTTIRGNLTYEAPEPATIPDSASILGEVAYTNASYLPNIGTSRILLLLNIGFFLFVRLLGALILAGLFAGLFPRLAESVVDRVYSQRTRSILLTMLLGFAIIVATPILFLMLSLTFVGLGLAFVLMLLYAFLLTLSVLYAGILVGSMFARTYLRRETVLWRDGVLGMLALSLFALIPLIGWLILIALMTFTAGTLLQLFFHFAFPREGETIEMV